MTRNYHDNNDGWWSKPVILCILMWTVTAAAYCQVANNGFISLDDARYVIDNSMVKGGFTLESIRWALTTRTDGNWFPLTWLSYTLDVSLAGSSARTIHISNLVYHLLNSSLLFAVLFRMTGAVYRSFMVALLFAIHPLHVESVAWVSERKDVLSTFFLLLTMLAYTRYSAKRNLFWYGLSLALFACGLMSKSMLVSTPLLLLLLDFWPLQKYSSFGSRAFVVSALEKIPFLILALFSAISTYNFQNNAITPYAVSSLFTNIKNAAVSYLLYIYKTFVPLKLAVLYPFDANISMLNFVAASVVLIVVSVLVLVNRNKRPYFMVGWYWFIVALVPVIGIVRVGDQSMADRYTYIPHIGLFIVLVWAVSEFRLVAGFTFKVKFALAVAIFSLLTVLTWNQVGRWRTSESLFSYTVEVTENNWFAMAILGYDYLARNELQKAEDMLRRSLAIKPKNPMALYNLGVVQNKLGNSDAALEQYKKAIAIDSRDTMAHYQIGLILLNRGDSKAALEVCDTLKTLDPQISRQLYNFILISGSTIR